MTSGDSSRRNLARGGIVGFAGAATSALLGFAFSVMLARMLGSEGAGVVTQATGVFALVMALAKVGLDSTTIYLLPRLSYDDPGAIRAALRYMCALAAGISLVVVVIIEAAAPLLWGDNPQVRAATGAVLWFVPAGALSLIMTAALRALGKMRDYVLVNNIMLPLTRLALVASAILAIGSYTSASVAWALPFLLVLVIAALMTRARMPDPDAGAPRWPAKRQRLEIISFALPRTLSAGLEQALAWLDVLLVGMLAGNGAAGVYGGAIRFIQAGMIVDTALRIVVSPNFSRLLHMRESDRLKSLYATATVWLVLFATPIHLLMAIFAPAVMRVLGEEFASGANVLVILCAGTTVTFCAGNIHSLLIMSGRSQWAAANKAVVVALNVAGNLLAIPRYGIEGAAAVWALCMIVDAGLALIQVRAFIGIRPRIGEILRPLAAVLVSVGIPAATIALVWGRDSFAAMGAGIGLGVICFAIMCRLIPGPLHLSGLRSLFESRK